EPALECAIVRRHRTRGAALDPSELELDRTTVRSAARALDAGVAAESHFASSAQPEIEREPRQTARAVAAEFRGPAVGIEIAHCKIELRIALALERAGAPVAAPPVAQPRDQRLRPLGQPRLAMVDHDEVVC